MIKSDSHDSGVEYHSQSEQLIREDPSARARRARRANLNASINTTSGDDTRREDAVPNARLRTTPAREARRRSPNPSTLPPLGDSTTVTVESETKPRRKKKAVKESEGEEVEMAVRKPSKTRRRKTSKESKTESGPTVDPRSNQILGIVIHRTDRLKTDLRLRHPFVRVHLIDTNTRSYMKKSDPNRLVLKYHNSNEPTVDHISTISTEPFDFRTNRSTIPSWEQLLAINEDYSQFTTIERQNVTVFFEILDYLDNPQNTADHSNTFPVAWAFLKVVGARNVLNTEHMVRLQLWEPMELLRSSNPLTPDVSLWSYQGKPMKYPSTLYVTLKPLYPPTSDYRPGIRSAKDGGIGKMTKDYEELLKREELGDTSMTMMSPGGTGAGDQLLGPLERVAQMPPRWQKLPNAKCKIPTELLFSVKTGDRGCSSIRFSHNGYFLACAEVSKAQENHLITVSELPRGQRVVVFTGHLQMIYELDWSKSDRYLASASADSFVKVWNFAELQKKPWRSLAHPSYVYCVRFHPVEEDILVTAGYDKLMRVWNLEKKHGTVMQTMADHLGYISSLSFNPDGTRLASVDSIGSIKLWHALPSANSSSHSFADSWKLESNLDFAELQNIPLNSVTYSPGDNYLLVSGRENLVILIDVRTKSITRRYVGAFNVQDRIHSTFSPCGSLVFSGSEDRSVHCWHTYNGNLVYSYQSLNYVQPVLDVQFHPFDNILAMCSIGPSHQVFVFHHTFTDADYEAKPIKPSTMTRATTLTFPAPAAPILLSDTDQRPPRSGRMDSGSEDVPMSSASRTDHRNRRLAVVTKMLDEMDTIIDPKSARARRRESITDYGNGRMTGRSTDQDFSPYQDRRSNVTSGYNSDAGRPPLVSPLRGLTSPDLFVPTSNRLADDDDDDQDDVQGKSSSSGQLIMYATVNYKSDRPEEISFSKNDPIKILNKESHLLWYAEHLPSGRRGYVSPNRVHIQAKDSNMTKKRSDPSGSSSISDIPRLNRTDRRPAQKSVTFDNSD